MNGGSSSRPAALAAALAVASLILPATAAGQPAAGPEQQTAPVTLGEAIRRASDTHPSIRASETATEAARARLDREQSDWWPNLSLVGSATQYQKPMVVHPIHGFTPGETPPFDRTLLQGGAQLGYTLFGDGRSGRIRSARASAEASRAGARSVAGDVATDVSTAYLAIHSGERVLDAHDRRMAALEAELDRAREQHEVGKAPRVQVIRAEAELSSARAERVQVASDLEVARRRLARLMGASAEEVERRGVAAVSPAASTTARRSEWIARAERGSPVLERARREQEAADGAASAARSARLPDLELGANWMDRGSADGNFLAEWGVGLNVSVPIFTGGRVSSEIARAEAESRRAAAAAEATRIRIADAVDAALSALEAARPRVAALGDAVRQAEEVARIEKLRLEAGRSVQPDYLDAEARLMSARANRAEAEHAVVRARVQLARITGELDAAWIEENIRTGGSGR
jgi:outer membrane protein